MDDRDFSCRVSAFGSLAEDMSTCSRQSSLPHARKNLWYLPKVPKLQMTALKYKKLFHKTKM